MVQPDMKKLVAYSSVSHLGFVVLGLAALNVNGVQGAVYQMLAHGISTGGLFLVVGMLSDRRHTRQIAEFGGLKAVTPQLVAAFLLLTLASVALPGMNGFVGEFLILIGAFGSTALHGARVYTAIAATGVILSAVYMLWMFQRVNYGPITNEKNRGLRDLSVREWFVIGPVCAIAIVMGVIPGVFLRPMEPAVRRTVERIVPGSGPVNAGREPAAVVRIDPPPAAAGAGGTAPAAPAR
jgi:NADH-quinone oxidoreductase subunit M